MRFYFYLTRFIVLSSVCEKNKIRNKEQKRGRSREGESIESLIKNYSTFLYFRLPSSSAPNPTIKGTGSQKNKK